MNVRFFGGLKAEYVGLSKHNPVALYFCADTRELFWGDRLLSDGARVVASYDALPSITENKAAEGIIYFVEDTGSGYVLFPGRSEWTKVFSTGTAGITEVDLTDYYTKAEVDEAILEALATIKIPEADLTGYATKQFVTEAIASIPKPDLSGYAKLEDIPNLDNYVLKDELPNTAAFATKDELQDAISAIEHPTIDLSGYATETFVKAFAANQKCEVLPIDGMLITYRGNEVRLNTERVVPTQQNVGPTGSPNMFYATFRAFAPEGATHVIDGIINGTTGEITRDDEPSILAEDSFGRKYKTIWPAIAQYTGTSWLNYGAMSNTDKYLGHRYVFDWYNGDTLIGSDRIDVILTNDSCHNDPVPEDVAKRIKADIGAIEIPSVEGLATETFVQEEIAKIEVPDVNNFITEIPDYYVTADELAAEGFIKEHQSLEGYATKDFVRNAIAEAELNDKDIDVSGFATKDEIKDLAATAYVDEKIANIKHPAIPSKTSDLTNDSGYITSIPAEYVTEDALNAKGYLTKHQSLENYATKSELFSGDYNDLTNRPHIPSIDGLATEAFVNEAVEAITIPDTSDFITIKDVEAKGYLTNQDLYEKADVDHTHDDYALKEHTHAQYLTEHQSLEAYAKKEDLFSQSYNDLTNLPEIPSIDGLAAEVPFTTSKFVTKAVGGFQVGDDLRGYTIAELFAKLLGLSDEVTTPDEPNSLVDTLIANEASMYAITSKGELAKIPFNLMVMSEDEAAQPPTASGFYQIKDANGNVIESGYQEMQANSDLFYVIALPKAVDYETMVTAKGFDTLSTKTWVATPKPNMVSDPNAVAALCEEAEIDISSIDQNTYTILVCEDMTPSGSFIRYIITE